MFWGGGWPQIFPPNLQRSIRHEERNVRGRPGGPLDNNNNDNLICLMPCTLRKQVMTGPCTEKLNNLRHNAGI